MAKVLVIGANGFIGSHLVDGLARAGHKVTAFDRFSSGPPTFNTSDARIVRGDFLSRSDLEGVVQGQDMVLHFLSTTSPATAEGDPTLDLRTNVGQTIELLESCVGAGVGHFYFASTGGAIYGPQGKAMYIETDPTLPVSPYAIGKLTIENYLRYFRVMHNLQSTSLRISNPYGTRQNLNKGQGLIPIALKKIMLGEPVVRFGDGSMVRDYIYVEDLVARIIRVVDSTARHSTYNLASGLGYTVNEIFASLERVTGIEPNVVEMAVPPTFVDRVVLNVDRFTEEFGNLDLTDLDTGISNTWRDIRRNNHD